MLPSYVFLTAWSFSQIRVQPSYVLKVLALKNVHRHFFCVANTIDENPNRNFLANGIKSPHILLIVHNKEISKWSNTGQILMRVTPREQCSLLIWNGRNDAKLIDDAIHDLRAAHFNPILVWPDDGSSTPSPQHEKADARSYILLDGTWQQAQDMFRKGPASLHSLPRLSLSPTALSSYRLRRNYGYKERFGTNQGLLCTAEAGAELLVHAGADELAAIVLAALDRFQAQFPARSPRPQE